MTRIRLTIQITHQTMAVAMENVTVQTTVIQTIMNLMSVRLSMQLVLKHLLLQVQFLNKHLH